MQVFATVTSHGDPKSTLRQLERRLGKRVEAGLRAVGRHIYDESQVLVPVDTGYQKSTGRVKQIESLLNTVITVGYGGMDFPKMRLWSPKELRMVDRWPMEYAVPLHEIPPSKVSHNYPEQYEFLVTPCRKLSVLKKVFFAGMGVP